MAFKQKWSHVKRAAEPTTFSGKYCLKRAGGMDKVGSECFVIPLDMAEGYSCLPYHSLKKNDSEGFHGSTFNSVKIACKKYDPNTGEALKELPLCCKLAQLEKERISDPEDSGKRALSFSNFRYVFPVLILSSTETDASKKPTLKKLSVKNGVSFSFVDLAESSYEEDIKNKVIEALTEDGIVEDVENMDQEELMRHVAEYISHSIIKITNVPGKSSSIPYQKGFRVISMKNNLIGQTSGEANLIKTLGKLLAGEYLPEQLDSLYHKAPILQEINNQVIDFLQLYNDNVDSLVEPWEDDELQQYYNEFVARQNQIEKYKSVNEQAVENQDEEEEEETVEFETSLDDVEADESLDSLDIEDSDEVEEVKSTAKKPAKKKVAVAAGSKASDDTYDVTDLDSDTTDDISEEDFAMGDDDFEDLL